MAILIKRYANRKLYNTETSRYITLRGVGELLDRGEEVRVVDNETGEDITQVALSQILVDNKRSREVPSDTLLTQILSRGGDAVYSAIRKSVDDASDGLGEFQERFRQLVQRGEAARSRGFGWERRDHDHRDPRDSRDRHDPRAHREEHGEPATAAAWPTRADVERLNRNLERVAAALDRLESALASSRPRT